MSEFEFWKMAYTFGWATLADLDTAVARGLITAEQKDQIIGTPA